jgi:ribosome-associated protein
MLVVNQQIQIPHDEFSFSYVRSSGPGGQNVNKVASRAILRWNVAGSRSLNPSIRDRFVARYTSRLTIAGELIVSSQRFRDQKRNVDDCLEKLKAMLLAVARAPAVRRPTRPGKAARTRRLDAKRKRSQTKRGRRRPRDEE